MARLRAVVVAAVRGLCLLAAGCRAYQALSDASLRGLPDAGSDFDVDDGALLAPLLRPRVPGTPGQAAAQAHFADFFARRLPRWTLQWQNSTQRTPLHDAGLPFANLILRRDPPWAAAGDVSRLTLAAHYDSLAKFDGFVGAIDSAAPCAMLMHVARSVDEALTRKWDSVASADADDDSAVDLDFDLGLLAGDAGVQIILIDGEEAFVRWTDEDSLYGSRSLAEEWESSLHPALSTFRNPLSSISLFILLDLLGSPAPRVPSYFLTTHWAYQRLAAAERRLRDLGLLRSTARQRDEPFLPDSAKLPASFDRRLYIGDDHVPFMSRGVDVLHLIPNDFPPVWHTMDDDGAHLDGDVVHDWAKIVTAFVAEWMELDGFMPGERAVRRDVAENKTEL